MVKTRHQQQQHQQSLKQETGLQHLLLQQRHHQERKQGSLILQWLQVLLQRPQSSTVHYYHAFREYFCRHRTYIIEPQYYIEQQQQHA